jgi:hypothetical protein
MYYASCITNKIIVDGGNINIIIIIIIIECVHLSEIYYAYCYFFYSFILKNYYCMKNENNTSTSCPPLGVYFCGILLLNVKKLPSSCNNYYIRVENSVLVFYSQPGDETFNGRSLRTCSFFSRC